MRRLQQHLHDGAGAGGGEGSITAVAASALRDGEKVTISDGNTAVIFEFDVSNTGSSFNGVGAGHVAVQVIKSGASADDAHDVAVKLATAINGIGGELPRHGDAAGRRPARA